MKGILFIVALLCLVGAASATDYYVSTTGDNSSNGLTIGTAWKNVYYAVSQTAPGDTIYVLDGTYYDNLTIVINDARDGTITNPLTITAYNGTPILDGTDSETVDVYAFTIQGSSAYSTGYVTISNITFRNYKQIFDIRNAENITLANNTFYNVKVSQSYGIGLIAYSTRNITIDNNIFHDAVGYNSLAIGGAINSSDRVHHIYVTNNQIYNNDAHAAIQWGNADNMTVFGNTMWNNSYSGGITAYKGNPYEIINDSLVYDCDLNGVATPLYMSASYRGLWHNITINNSGMITLYGNAHADPYYLNNLTIRDITITHPTSLVTYLTGNGVAKDVLFERFDVTDYYTGLGYEWRIQDTDGNITIRDQIDPGSRIFLRTTTDARNASMIIDYTDGRVFVIESVAGSPTISTPVRYYPTISNYSEEIYGLTQDRRFRYTSSNITLRPTSANLMDVVVNTHDVVADITNITINSSVAENPTWINVTVVNASNTYNVSRDGIHYDTVVSGSDSILRYHYSIDGDEWSKHDFEFTWVNDSGWSAEENHIYYQRPFTVNNTGVITQLGTPTQYDIDLTTLTSVVIS